MITCVSILHCSFPGHPCDDIRRLRFSDDVSQAIRVQQRGFQHDGVGSSAAVGHVDSRLDSASGRHHPCWHLGVGTTVFFVLNTYRKAKFRPEPTGLMSTVQHDEDSNPQKVSRALDLYAYTGWGKKTSRTFTGVMQQCY